IRKRKPHLAPGRSCFCYPHFGCPRRSSMKRVALFLLLAGWFVPLAKAQDQFQLGAYGDYFRVSQTSTNMAGLGGRVGYKVVPHVMFEGEISYDFEQGFIEHCTSTSCVGLVHNSNLKVLHGMVGPTFIGGRHAIRPFLAVKAGFINFQLNPKPATRCISPAPRTIMCVWRSAPSSASRNNSREKLQERSGHREGDLVKVSLPCSSLGRQVSRRRTRHPAIMSCSACFCCVKPAIM